MLLIANGCSHTSGAEIEFESQGQCFDKAWPAQLAKIWKCEHINLAISGGSQTRVIRTTIECIGNLISKGYKPKDLFVIILWPGPYRTEVYEKERTESIWKGWVPLVVGNDYTGDRSDTILRYYKSWVACYDEHQANTSFYLDTILLQNYLKAWKINYFFFRAPTTNLSADSKFNSFKIQLDKKRFPGALDIGQSYCEILQSLGVEYSKHSSFAHYGEDGHKLWAKLLHDKIGKIYDYEKLGIL